MHNSKKIHGKAHLFMTGRALFKYNPKIFVDDEEADEKDKYDVQEGI